MRDETHCEHGTYVGYPGGPDYLCGYCEDGISMAQLRRAHDSARATARREIANHAADFMPLFADVTADKVTATQFHAAIKCVLAARIDERYGRGTLPDIEIDDAAWRAIYKLRPDIATSE